MKKQTSEKILGAALIAAACVSFIGTSNVQAQTVFPPAPHDRNAIFVEPRENAPEIVIGPWYRPAAAATVVAEEAARNGTREFAVAGPAVTPWYRAAN